MICALMGFPYYQSMGVVCVGEDADNFRWLCGAVESNTYAGGMVFGPVFEVSRFIDGDYGCPWHVFTAEFAPKDWLQKAATDRLWWMHNQLQGVMNQTWLLEAVDEELRERSDE